MASFRVLVTGSRTWTNEDDIEDAFKKVNRLNVPYLPVVLIHGGANGLDTEAAAIAHGEYGWRIEEHPANWYKHDYDHPTHPCPEWHKVHTTCKMAGHRRNSDMVRTRADVCFAFIKAESAGATGCAKLAEAANIPTYYYRED